MELFYLIHDVKVNKVKKKKSNDLIDSFDFGWINKNEPCWEYSIKLIQSVEVLMQLLF